MKSNILCFFAALLACSCVERVTIDTNSQNPKLIVVAMLTTDTMQQVVTITKSTNFFGGDTCPSVPDAKVWINDEQLTLLDAGKGAYATRDDFFLVPGNTYRLRVLYDMNGDGADEEFWAEDVVPHAISLLDIPGIAGIVVTPINMDGDTSKYAPPFIVSAFVWRENINDSYGRVTQRYHGKQRSENLAQYSMGDLSSLSSNPVAVPGICTITRGGFFLEDQTDTVFYCPFDTVTLRVNSVTAAMARYVSSARQESNGSANPMFGGAPANVESNINGANVMGCFGLSAGGRAASFVLPMNTKTLDGDNVWFNMRDTTLQITIRNEGVATYATGPLKGQEYFRMESVDAHIKGFWADKDADKNGFPAIFEMKSYNEFWDVAGNEKWMRGSRAR
ncbi:MAG: DUF4249 domain-containing protein [Prevotellaceae bacterium]|jgi:hypothetical protein|nr:DUF4249 domain-containing protein [Prevotellaceae bacterium]